MRTNPIVKLDIISGFLGAGKTTFINKLLSEVYTEDKPILLENEFGDVGIDDSLIDDPNIQIRLFSSGCICCTIKGNFVEGITEIIEQYNPMRIIIEPTGLADPDEIMSACEEASRKVDLEINSFITIANSANLLSLLTLGGEVFKKQIIKANPILLNRTHLLSSDKLIETINRIRSLNSECVIIEQGEKDLDTLSIITLAEETIKQHSRCDEHHICHHEHEHEHELKPSFEDIISLAFYPEKTFTPDELDRIIKVFSEELKHVLRAKGFLKTHNGYVRFQYVYGQGEYVTCIYNSSPKFVIIGRNLEKLLLNQLLD